MQGTKSSESNDIGRVVAELVPKQAYILLWITDNNIWFMNLNSPIYDTFLQNKFFNLVFVFVHLRFWSLSRPKRIW